MFTQILSATSQYAALGILAAFFVLMIVMTIVPQKKRQKQMQSMMDNLTIGDKVMTIGRLIGKIVAIDNENKQVTLNVGTDDSETLIVIDRNAIGYVIDGKNKPVEEKSKKENFGFHKKHKKDEKAESVDDTASVSTSSAEDTSNISIDSKEDVKIDNNDDVKF